MKLHFGTCPTFSVGCRNEDAEIFENFLLMQFVLILGETVKYFKLQILSTNDSFLLGVG
jgi:hypothetical protein